MTISRKSCKAQIYNELLDQKGNRSRSLDSGSSKSYQKDLITEKKNSFFQNHLKTMEENGEKVLNNEKEEYSSEGSDIKNNTNKKELKKEIAMEENNETNNTKLTKNKKMFIQLEEEKKEEIKNDDLSQENFVDLGTQ